MIFKVSSSAEIEEALQKIHDSAEAACRTLRQLDSDPIHALSQLKFSPVGSHPLDPRPLNIVEQINQTFTCLAALRAAQLLLGWHPEAEGFLLAPGAHAPRGSLDLQSLVPGIVGAETFAAVKPNNNGKLAGDLKKLADRPEKFRYVFFICPRFPRTERCEKLERRGVQVWSVSMRG